LGGAIFCRLGGLFFSNPTPVSTTRHCICLNFLTRFTPSPHFFCLRLRPFIPSITSLHFKPRFISVYFDQARLR
jgi:hypothetical protein